MKRVFLIDSMSHIFRAFFAPMGMRQEPMRNSKGQVTQAVFVFTNMLRKLLNDEKPDYVAAVFDTAAPTFRHDSFDAYKANREAMPDDLASQLPFIVRVCEAFNIPILKMDGFEADDIIGTLANECRLSSFPTTRIYANSYATHMWSQCGKTHRILNAKCLFHRSSGATKLGSKISLACLRIRSSTFSA